MMREAVVPSFGQTIRGARLGFRWSAKYEAMIRITMLGQDSFEVEMCHPAGLPNAPRKQGSLHSCWWDDPTVLDTCPAIRNYRGPSHYVSFIVNDEGKQAR